MAGPHDGQPVLLAGESLERASAAMILVHGRGASARDIMTIAAEVGESGFAFLAPEAAGGAWYPNRFMEPVASNEPWLSSALETVGRVLALVEERLPAERVILLGFSQGACLTLEFAARNARRYGGIVGLTGGLIGPDDTARDYPGSLEGTPVFLGCSDVDPHIPVPRVLETAKVLEALGAVVTTQFYPGMGHEVNADELEHVRRMMAALARRDQVGKSAGR
ncbi:MAG TPA: dienelactone hydrolase family protein [Solirubrobacterales bacterium]|nr:dienelactone hydrolase family protein [Solirubrobacterales bacterium]